MSTSADSSEQPQLLSLARLNRVTQLLAEAKTLNDVRQIRDMAEAARAYAKAAKLGGEAVNRAAAIKLKAERRAGELLKETQKHPAGRPSQNPSAVGRDLPPKLDGLGITYRQSSDWQALASVDEATFEAIVDEAVDAGKVSTAGVVEKARKHQAKQDAALMTTIVESSVDVQQAALKASVSKRMYVLLELLRFVPESVAEVISEQQARDYCRWAGEFSVWAQAVADAQQGLRVIEGGRHE